MGAKSKGRTSDFHECFTCHEAIKDEYRLTICGTNCHFHQECLKCFSCKAALYESYICYERNGNHFCPSCYDRLFLAFKCHRCHEKLTRRDLILTVKDQCYHKDCFTCTKCGLRLNQGDTFGIHSNETYCKEHFVGVSKTTQKKGPRKRTTRKNSNKEKSETPKKKQRSSSVGALTSAMKTEISVAESMTVKIANTSTF